MPSSAASAAPALKARFPDRSASASDSVGPPRPRRVAVLLRWCCGGCCGAPRRVTTGHSGRSQLAPGGERDASHLPAPEKTRLDRRHESTSEQPPLVVSLESRRHSVGFFESSAVPTVATSTAWPASAAAIIVTRRSSNAPAPKPFPGGRPAEQDRRQLQVRRRARRIGIGTLRTPGSSSTLLADRGRAAA